MPQDDLTYRMPPDILHYETRYIFGLSQTEIMIGAMAGMGGIVLFGPVIGLVAGLLVLLGLKRFESLGDRSVVTWAVLRAWHKRRPQVVRLPRTLPQAGARLVIQDWEGATLYTVEQKTS